MELRITTLIASGDHPAALTELDRCFGNGALRYCVALTGRQAEGEELYQETLIQAFDAMPRFRGGSAKAWFFGVARRTCAAHLKRRDRRRGLFSRFRGESGDGLWHGGSPDSPRDPAEASEARVALTAALKALKPPLREAVLLKYLAGLDGPELAATLNISHAAARKRASLGIQALRAALGPVLQESALTPNHDPNTTEAPDEHAMRSCERPRIVHS